MRPSNLIRGTVAVITIAAFGVVSPLAATAGPNQPAGQPMLVASDGTTAGPAELAQLPDIDVVHGTKGTGIPGNDGASHDKPVIGDVLDEQGVDSVILPDDRYRTSPANWHPASATVQLTRTINGVTTQYCSGWLIGANTVITAGHCVHNGTSWLNQGVTVYPGRDVASAPFGSCAAPPGNFHSNTEWTVNQNPDWDYGAIKLNCTVGNTTGTYGFFWQSASLNGTPTYVRGYPCDKPFGQQWASYDKIHVSGAQQLYYQNDTYNCQSGSPVYTYNSSFCSGACGAAVHAYGTGGGSYNHGARITQAKFDHFVYWRNL